MRINNSMQGVTYSAKVQCMGATYRAKAPYREALNASS